MRKNYFYPDENDKVTLTFISKNEPFTGYWTRSEEYVLNLMKKHVEDYVKKSGDTWFLDAGCGTGRLLPNFTKHFNRILAIDPDCCFLEIARTTATKHGFAEKATFQCTSIENLDWKNESINVILCSHVLQHVHTNSVSVILEKLGKLLVCGGLLFITTNHSKEKHDLYAKSYLKDDDVVKETINEGEFNTLIYNEMHVVPLHLFSKGNIIEPLNSLQFEVFDFKSFHILNQIPLIDQVVFRDKFFNFFSFLQSRAGEDMFIAARKLV